MVNEHSQVVCDITKIILDDGKCVYPGYVEITGHLMTRHFSDDPRNKMNPFLTDSQGRAVGPNPEYQVGMLTNRKEFERVEGPVVVPEDVPDGHYLDFDTLYKAMEILAVKRNTGKIPEKPDGDMTITVQQMGAVAPDQYVSPPTDRPETLDEKVEKLKAMLLKHATA